MRLFWILLIAEDTQITNTLHIDHLTSYLLLVRFKFPDKISFSEAKRFRFSQKLVVCTFFIYFNKLVSLIDTDLFLCFKNKYLFPVFFIKLFIIWGCSLLPKQSMHWNLACGLNAGSFYSAVHLCLFTKLVNIVKMNSNVTVYCSSSIFLFKCLHSYSILCKSLEKFLTAITILWNYISFSVSRNFLNINIQDLSKQVYHIAL